MNYRFGIFLACSMIMLMAVAATSQTMHSQLTILKETQWQNTPSVTISRGNSSLIAIAAMDDAAIELGLPVYISDDRGLTWSTHRIPRVFGWEPFMTPSIASDANDNLYCSYVAARFATSTGGFFVAHSHAGERWSYSPVLFDSIGGGRGTWVSRPTLWVDNASSSPYRGRVYLVWESLDSTEELSGLRLCSSDDQARTWSAPQTLVTGYAGYAQVRTGAHGELVIGYAQFKDRAHICSYHVATSTDGGATRTEHFVSGFDLYPMSPTGRVLKGQNGISADPMQSISIDDANTIHSVYATWTAWNDHDSSSTLYYRASKDWGQHWTDSVRIGSSATAQRDRFFPSITSDPSLGTAIVYYSSELDTANRYTTVMLSRITEDGPDHGTPLRTSPFDPLAATANLQPSLGDYLGSDARNGTFVAAWTSERTDSVTVIWPDMHGSSDVVVYVSTTGASVPVRLNDDRLWCSPPYPNPATDGVVRFNYTVPDEEQLAVRVVDASGRTMSVLRDGHVAAGSYVLTLATSGWPSGTYELVLESSGGLRYGRRFDVIH